MLEVIFCLASLALLVWVILLKLELDGLNKQARNLKAHHAKNLEQLTRGLQVSKEQRVWRGKPKIR